MNVSDVRPLIGITTYYQHATWGVWNGEAAILPGNYLHAVVDAGGIPVLLPPRGTGTKVLDTLDGLLVIGGSDVDPSRYGENAHPTTEFDTERDSHDFVLLGAAEALGLPILCVCRGAQVLNVAHGGSLLQHLPDVLPEGERYRCAPGVFSDTRITIDPESLAHSILGDSCTVSSYHHQGLDRIGKGLMVTARSADGLPQILESTDDSWLIATQYHPEEKRLEDRRLFAAFVAACGSRTEAVSDTKPTPSEEITE